MKKATLKIIFILCFIIFFTFLVNNQVKALDITISDDENIREIKYNVSQQITVNKEITNPTTTEVYNKILNTGVVQNLSTSLVGLYCQITGVAHGRINTYMPLESEIKATYKNDAKKAYIYSDTRRSTTQSEWCSSFTQLLAWKYRGFALDRAEQDVNARENWKNALAFENYGNNRVEWENANGKEYTQPSIVQTNPISIDYLAGPYRIDYVMGVEDNRYICEIQSMEMRDKTGNIIQLLQI